MTILNALLLGIIQGVAEFLPISSSGHLSIAQNLLGMGMEGADDVFFDVLLHLGTLAAVFVAYWADIREMILEFIQMIRDAAGRSSPQRIPSARRMILLIVVGTLPLFLILPVKGFVEGLYATCPGISRSGMTICMGCFTGFERRFAVRFAFLLSIPAVLGANILQIKDVAAAGGIDVKLLPAYILGVLVAAVSGYFSIRLVRMVADKGRFGSFAYYCCAAGSVTVILSFLKFFNLLWYKAAV